MYMDRVKHEYITATNAPYAVRELPRGHALPEGYTFNLAGDLVTLFDRVRKSRPGWKLKVDYGHTIPASGSARHVTVWSGDNPLGKVWLESVWQRGRLVTGYSYTNERVDRSLKRRRHKFTTNMVNAARGILQSFFDETFTERMKKVSPKARAAALDSLMESERPFRALMPSLSNMMLDFALANWDMFVAANPTVDKRVPEAVESYRASQKARSRPLLYLYRLPSGDWTKGEAIDIDHYSEWSAGTMSDPRLFLTEAQFLSLTMLRLQDTNRFVEGHGIRIDDNTFVLVS